MIKKFINSIKLWIDGLIFYIKVKRSGKQQELEDIIKSLGGMEKISEVVDQLKEAEEEINILKKL